MQTKGTYPQTRNTEKLNSHTVQEPQQRKNLTDCKGKEPSDLTVLST